jgi:hypothetical protein
MQPATHQNSAQTQQSTMTAAVTSKALAARFPNAHRILSELHTMKRLNEELFMQLEESRIALNTLAEQVPHAAEALAGITHNLDPTSSASLSLGAARNPKLSSFSAQAGSAAAGPAASRSPSVASVPPLPPPPTPEAADEDDSGPASVKRRFFQFVDEAFEKAKHAGGPSPPLLQPAGAASSAAPSFEQMYIALRLKATAQENAQGQLSMANQRLEDCREELGKVRKAFSESSDEFDRCREERDALRLAISVLKAPPAPTAHIMQPQHSTPSDASGRTTASKEARVDALFDDLFDDGKKVKHTAAPSGVASALGHKATATSSGYDAQQILSDNQALAVAIQRLTGQLHALETTHSSLMAQHAPLEKLLTAAQLEIEGLHDTIASLNKEVAALRSHSAQQDATRRNDMADMEELKRAHAVSLANLRSESAKLLETTAALSSMKSLPQKLTSLQRELTECQNRLSEATAVRIAQEQLREQREREVFALQRMLNSRELDSEAAEVGGVSASVNEGHQHDHRGAVNAVASRSVAPVGNRRGGGNTVSVSSPTSSTSVVAGEDRGGDEMEEALHRTRLTLKSALQGKKRADVQLAAVTQERDCLRKAVASLGKRVMSLDARIVSTILVASSAATTQPPPLSPVRETQPFGPLLPASTPPTHRSRSGSIDAFTRVGDVMLCTVMCQTAPSINDSPATADREDHDEKLSSHVATIKVLEESVTALQKEKRVLQQTVMELQETLIVSAAASPFILESRLHFVNDDSDDDSNEGSTESHPEETPPADSRAVPSRVIPVIRGGTWQAYPTPVTSNSSTAPRGAPSKQKGIRGFFGRMVGSSKEQQQRDGGAVSGKQPPHLELVPKQQLHTIQKLLESQIKENLVLQAQLDEASGAKPAQSGR